MIASSGVKIWISSAILTALVLCSVVPFAARAVYLDEHLYLHLAESAIKNDWRFPQDTPFIFFGTRVDNLAPHTHPPVGEYFLALMLKLFGGFEEIRFRLLWAVFSLIAVLGFYRLARHFTPEPLLVASFFAVAPAFFVLSPTLMMDIPMLAFFLWGLGFYLDNLQGRSIWLLPASICFILSAGTGYTAMVPMACLFVWAATKKRPVRELGFLALAPVAVLAWLVLMKIHFGALPVIGVVRYFASHASFPGNLLPTFSFLGGVSLLPWAFLALVNVPRKPIVVGFSVVTAVLLSFFHRWPTLPSRLWFVTLASSGIGLWIAFAFKAARRDSAGSRPARGFLLLWFPAILFFFLFSAEMVSARYILLSLPPLFLIIFNPIRRAAAVPVLALTLILSVLIAAGDYRFVNSYRDWVSRAIVPLQQQGFRIWSAAESGLRFYLEQRGIQTLDKLDIRPRGGDLIVKQASFAYSLSDQLGSLLVPLARIDLADAYPVRTFVAAAGAGFHDSHFGLVPFSFSRAPLDRLELAQVSPFLRSLPQVVPADFSSVPVWFPGGVLLKQVQPEMKFHVRMPRDARVEYQLEGEGSVELSSECITLRKIGKEPILWKNFRIIPGTWKAAD
jgi:hypothetical protein